MRWDNKEQYIYACVCMCLCVIFGSDMETQITHEIKIFHRLQRVVS
jgi:hypothetical protein